MENLVQRQRSFAGQTALIGAHAAELSRIGLTRAEHAVGNLRVWKQPRVRRAELRHGASAANVIERVEADDCVLATGVGQEPQRLTQRRQLADHVELDGRRHAEWASQVTEASEVVAQA